MSKTRTNSTEVVLEQLAAAKIAMGKLRHHVESAERSLDYCIDGIKRDTGCQAFPISWTNGMMEELTKIMCEISRANGAALVDQIIEEKEED